MESWNGLFPHTNRDIASSSQFESLDKTYHLTELARGDFSGDGFEDTLVAVSWHYREGAGLGNEILLVQRVQPKPLPPPALVPVCF